MTTVATGGRLVEPAPSAPADEGAAPPPVDRPRRFLTRETLVALLFLLPALVLLGALVVYPIGYTIVRSFFDRAGDSFIGIDNYRTMFETDRTFTAIKNNAIWVVVAPTIATILGLIFAVMAERVRWETAFKFIVFMPMAVSFLAAGVIFRFVYERDPDQGLANAMLTTVVEVFDPPGEYRGARPADEELLVPEAGGLVTAATFSPGAEVNLGLVAIRPSDVPDGATDAAVPDAPSTGLGGVVWLDFSRGGGGERGVVDEGESGLPGVALDAVRDGEVVASTTTADDGSYVFDDLEDGSYELAVSSSNFRAPWTGVNWLGANMVTWSVIGAFLWIWAGFSMIVIGAGLAAIPRDVLEAARVDGANEWQVFRRVTVPLLLPILLVVFVTLVINVLKIFDLVFVIPPPSTQDDANVIALEMWRVSFGGARDYGLGSALAVLLFVLVLPAMIFNIRRFRAEN
jgi:alpha-glucoside transport system permease protein